MAEQEQKQGQALSEDAWKKAISSWRSRASDTDFDELETPLREDISGKLKEGLKTHSEN